MRAVYIGFAVVIVLILAGFGIARWIGERSRRAAVAFETSTPTPAPGPTSAPVQLAPLQKVGKPLPGLTTPRGVPPDTQTGGRGSPVDDIPCESSEAAVLHVHSHLSLFVNGVQGQIPAFIGISPTFGGTGVCLYWLHTHDASGVIHVEAGDVNAPKGGPFTLGMFFDIWGQSLGRTQVGPFRGPVTVYVNGQQYAGNLPDIPLREAQMITLEVGKPVVPPPNYKLPPGS